MKKIYIYAHTVEYRLAKRKKEIQPFATTWMEPVGFVLRETSQTKTNSEWCHLVEPKKVTS